MIKLNKQYYYDTGVELYYISSFSGFEEVDRDSFSSCDMYETCESIIAKQNDEYYVMGCGSNTEWYGYKLGKELPKYDNLISLFKELEYKNS